MKRRCESCGREICRIPGCSASEKLLEELLAQPRKHDPERERWAREKVAADLAARGMK